MDIQNKVHKEVQEYYGQNLKGTNSLLTNACCVAKSNLTPLQKKVMGMINQQITSKFYGCGSPVPACLEGKTIVDLGCGTGVDVYIASYFAKQSGKVIGIDMTPAQLQVAKTNLDEMTKKYGFSKPNVQFIEANIEKIPLSQNSVDVVISNCVVNLSPNKQQVFKQIRRVLKNGGELYFSDVYANRRINQDLKADKVLWGECLSGALYVEDFRRIMDQLGFKDCRVISKSTISINNQKIEQSLKGIKFYSITYRCFKLDDIEDRCQDYGQKVRYLGGIQQFEDSLFLDSGHIFKKGQFVEVCGNTASMIKQSRFGKYFDVQERGEHLGLFDCSKGCTETEGGQNCCGQAEGKSGACC